MEGASHGSISAADDVSLPLSGRTVPEKWIWESICFFSALCRHVTARDPPPLTSQQPIRPRGDAAVRRNVRSLAGPDANLRRGAKWKPLTARPAHLASSDGKIKAYPNRNSLSSTPGRSMVRPPERNGSPLTLSSGRIISDLDLSLARRYHPESALSPPDDFSSLRRLRVRS